MERNGLFRSRKDRVFGGVAGGIARSLNADPAIIRLIFAILVIFGGGGILLYVILWIAIPEEPFEFYQESMSAGTADPGPDSGSTGHFTPPDYRPRRNNGALIAGLVLITVGLIFLIGRVFPDIRLHFHDFWPIIIVIAGLAIILSSFLGIKKNHNQ